MKRIMGAAHGILLAASQNKHNFVTAFASVTRILFAHDRLDGMQVGQDRGLAAGVQVAIIDLLQAVHVEVRDRDRPRRRPHPKDMSQVGLQVPTRVKDAGRIEEPRIDVRSFTGTLRHLKLAAFRVRAVFFHLPPQHVSDRHEPLHRLLLALAPPLTGTTDVIIIPASGHPNIEMLVRVDLLQGRANPRP